MRRFDGYVGGCVDNTGLEEARELSRVLAYARGIAIGRLSLL